MKTFGRVVSIFARRLFATSRRSHSTLHVPAFLVTVSVINIVAFSSDADAAEDTCTEDGGTAYCVGPELGPYKYQVSNGNLVIAGGTEEAATIAAFTQLVQNTYQACTLNVSDNRPQWPPAATGSGNTSNGNYSQALFQGVGQYWAIAWYLGVDNNSAVIPIVYNGTYPIGGTQPCAQSFGPWGAYVNRIRDVACPSPFNQPFLPNFTTPSNDYCYRASNKREPKKNLGQQCPQPVLFGNPINAATGNKLQVEVDYVGQGDMPLRFGRYYNSQLWGGTVAPTGGHGNWSRLGYNWRTSYDGFIRFSNSITFPTAYVYRPDGRTLYFKLSNGVFNADADIADRLVRLTDGSGNPTGWRYTVAATEEVETYNEAGKLISITNRAGLTQSLTYDASGLLSTVTDAFGRTLSLSYNVNGRLATLTVPGGSLYSYGYNSTGSVTSVTYPDTRVRTYVYNESTNTSGANRPFALTGVIDEDNSRFATFKYDTQERAISSEHAGAVEKYSFTYGTDSAVVTDPLNTARTHTFTTLHGVARNTSASQPCANCGGSAAAATSYDANGNASSKTDFNGSKICYAHDLSRNLETVRVEGFATGLSCPANLSTYTPTVGTRQRKISTQWHSTYRLPTQIDELGKRTTFTHDASGNVLTRTVLDTNTSESRTWAYTYNSFGRVLTADGPRTDVSDVTTYTYYSCTTGFQCGQIQTITNALGHLTTYNAYNAHGQPLTITDPNGLVTTLTYDLRQRFTSRTVGSEQAVFEYWPTGLLKKTTLPDSSFLEYTYDAAHRLTQVNDSEGNRIVYTLDAMGNRTAEQAYDPSNALTQTRTRVFNTLNRLWKEIGAAGTANVTTAFAYDNNGNQTGINAPLSRNTVQSYDELNRLKQVTDPLSGVTQYGYDALDQLISVTDPRSKVTSYTYNALGDLTQQVSPDTGTTSNTYDSGGNLHTSTDARAKTATYGYDALNRLTSLTYPDQTIGYAYDSGSNQKGRLTQVTDASGSTSWSYDAHGRVLTRQQSMGVAKTLGYAYDTAGRLQTLTLPSGNTVTYGYTNGKVTSLTLNGSTTILSNVLYQPFGPTRGWTWGNSTLAIREYDTDGKITDIDSAGLKTYSYDNAFRLTGITDTSNSTLSQSYGYDLLDRLTSATGTSLNQGWTYDANGNRLTQTGSQASTFTVSTTNNRLSGVSGTLTRTYGYDNSGNTTTDGATTFTYNDAGRMVSATKAGITTSYAINALGQRVKKTTSGVSTHFVYDQAGYLVGEYDSSGNLIQETVWFEDIPVATLRPNGSGGINLFYLHTDHLNTPRRISRQSDNVVVWRWDSDPFGTTAVNEDPDGDTQQFVYNLRFPGSYADAETGLLYNWHRNLDPATGRYTKSDPIGLRGGLNTYAYVKNNPVRNYDPNGLEIFCGDHWCGSDLPVYPKPKKCGCSKYQLNVGTGPELSGFFLFGGAAVSATIMGGTDGQVCRLFTVCGRLGFGMWAGGEWILPIGGTRGGTDNSGGWDVGCGFDLGWGAAVGGDITVGRGSAQVQAVPGIGGGWGGWGGGQLCRSFIRCTKLLPECECQQ